MAQLGRALGSGPRGRWFESSQPDHFSPRKIIGAFNAVSGVFGIKHTKQVRKNTK